MIRGPCSGKLVRLAMAVPQRVRASSAVSQAARYEGSVAVASMPRLRELLATDAAAVEVDLGAEKAFGRSSLKGILRGSLLLQCRRCDKNYVWQLDSQLDLCLVESEEQERAVLESADPYWVQDDQLPLHEIIEDEVILALPMLPRCPTCESIVRDAPLPKGEVAPRRRENPFAALKERFKSDQ